MVGVSIEDVSDANFLIALTNTISHVTETSTNRISLTVNSRRNASIQATIQSESKAKAERSSSAISETSSSGTFNSKLFVQLASTSYSGSIPSSMTVTMEVVTNGVSEGGDVILGIDRATLLVIVIVTSVGCLLIVVSIYCLSCRQKASGDQTNKASENPSSAEQSIDEAKPTTFLGAVEPNCLKHDPTSVRKSSGRKSVTFNDIVQYSSNDRPPYMPKHTPTKRKIPMHDVTHRWASADNDDVHTRYMPKDSPNRSRQAGVDDGHPDAPSNAPLDGRGAEHGADNRSQLHPTDDNSPGLVDDPCWFTATIAAATAKDAASHCSSPESSREDPEAPAVEHLALTSAVNYSPNQCHVDNNKPPDTEHSSSCTENTIAPTA